VDFCVRAVLRKRGTCNPAGDIQDQCYEIEKEVWYEGERAKRPVGAERREEIARSWASQHASKWREWRLFQLLYVWEKEGRPLRAHPQLRSRPPTQILATPV
jgi:hypothetical protein